MMSSSSKFTVRDGALIGDLRDAIQPIVWRLDLTRVHAVAFKVMPQNGLWDLAIEGPKGEVTAIASYASAEKAQKAYKSLSCALRYSGLRFLPRFSTIAIVAIVALFFLYVLPKIAMDRLESVQRGSGAAVSMGQSESADKVLRPPVMMPSLTPPAPK